MVAAELRSSSCHQKASKFQTTLARLAVILSYTQYVWIVRMVFDIAV